MLSGHGKKIIAHPGEEKWGNCLINLINANWDVLSNLLLNSTESWCTLSDLGKSSPNSDFI